MPSPQINSKAQARERPTYEEMLWENLQETKTEVRETRRELNARVDKLEEEIKATRLELNGRIDKLENKIDDMHKEIKSSTGHISIANISTVGIALAVIYAVLK